MSSYGESRWRRPSLTSAPPRCDLCRRHPAALMVIDVTIQVPRMAGPDLMWLCRECAAKRHLPCTDCGVYVPAEANVDGVIRCATCQRRMDAPRRRAASLVDEMHREHIRRALKVWPKGDQGHGN